MRSRFFLDTQGLDAPWRDGAPDQISVCLRLSRDAYERALCEASRRGLTSGAYIDWLLTSAERGDERFPPALEAPWRAARAPRYPT